MVEKNSLMVKYFVYLIAAFALFTYFHDLFRDALFSPYDDIGHYYLCSKMLNEGYDLYQWGPEVTQRALVICKESGIPESIAESLPIHSLSFFWIFLPFSFLPFKTAVYAWLIFTQLALFASLFLILKRIRNFNIWHVLFSLFLVFSFWPLREEFHMGQPNLLILFCFTASLLLTEKKFPFAAGLCLALGIQIKEIFLPVALFFLWKRNWKAVLGVGTGIIALKILPILTFGLDKEISYWQYHDSLWNFGKFQITTWNISLMAIFGRIGSGVIGKKIIWLIVNVINLILLGRTLWATRRRGESSSAQLAMEYFLFIILCFLISPWVREPHVVVLYLPILACWFCLEEIKKKRYFVMFIVMYLLLGLKYSLRSLEFFHYGLPAVFTGLKLWGCFVLYFLIERVLRQQRLSGNCQNR